MQPELVHAPESKQPKNGSTTEVFHAFLKLGLTSFGGPVAHLGYFRSEFVERRKWLDDKSYSDLGCVDNQASQIKAAAMEMNASNRMSSLS